jgi:hypothetical protein
VTSDFPHPNQGTVVWDSSSTHSGLRLRGYHPLWQVISDHFSLTSEEAAGPLTLHLPQVSLRDSVWTVPASLAATKGIPFWFLFLPLLRCFRSGGSRSVKEQRTLASSLRSPIQVSSVLRLLAPTRGGIAACRALLRLSSRAILQTAWHVRANGSVCLAFGENLSIFSTYTIYCVVLRVVNLAYAWCHCEALVTH